MSRRLLQNPPASPEHKKGKARGKSLLKRQSKPPGRRLPPGVPRPGRAPGKIDKPLLPNFDTATQDQLLTVEQVCLFLSISDWLARRLIKKGELPAVYIGDMVRVRIGDIREFIAERRRPQKPVNDEDRVFEALRILLEQRQKRVPKVAKHRGRASTLKGNEAQASKGS